MNFEWLDPTVPGHARRRAYYAHQYRKWVAYCECGWYSAEQTWSEHVREVQKQEVAS